MKPATKATKPYVRGRGRGETGVATVELAVILPFLVLLLIGTLELGLLVRDHQALQNAAREGARFSALPGNKIATAAAPATTRANIESVVIAYLANDGITLSGGDITIDQAVPMTVGAYTVHGSQIEVRYDRTLLFGLLDSIGLSNLTLYGNALFRNFYGWTPPGFGPPPTPNPTPVPPTGGRGGQGRGPGRAGR